MTVYVDDAAHSFGRMIMCHMVAPDVEELHAMADRIGVSRRWFQDPRTMNVSAPHYDIAKSKRALAVAAGAVEIDKYQMSVLSRWANFALTERGNSDPLALFRAMDSERLPELEAWLRAQGWPGMPDPIRVPFEQILREAKVPPERIDEIMSDR
jgi:hypothetical protein